MMREQPFARADVLVAWDFKNTDVETTQQLFIDSPSPLALSGTLRSNAHIKHINALSNDPAHTTTDISTCSCTVDVIALVERLSRSMNKSELPEFTAFLPQLSSVCGSGDANLERSFIAMDWFVHQFGPNLLRTIGHEWMATELEKTPKTADHRTLERAINACSGATYFVDGTCSHVFHAGYQAGEALLEMTSGSIRSSGAFGRTLGGAIATGESMFNRFLAVGRLDSERTATGSACINALGWNELVARLLDT